MKTTLIDQLARGVLWAAFLSPLVLGSLFIGSIFAYYF